MGAELESAVPEHLVETRTRPAGAAADFAPPYPSFVARHPASVGRIVLAHLGSLGPPDDGHDVLDAALAGPDGPGHHDRAVPVDGRGTITVGYWDDPDAFDRWFGAHRAAWLDGDGRTGRYVEVVRPRVERLETVFGARGRPEGVAVLAERFSGPVREHAYWGAMRDRLPASQTDALHDPGELTAHRDGDRVRVTCAGSVCLIRSGQDWSDCPPAERATYVDVVEPNLRAGMDHLAGAGLADGCLANRYVRVLGADGRPAERTYGLGWWRSLADLERWSASHPTHLAIFGAFTRLVRDQGGRTRLRLYHEVAVADPDEQWFEYARCDGRTGLLGALPGR